ncbi:MAG: S-layer homology domain-containing protein, partial [Cyanobacteria bacterium P01_A01_bin.135]
QAAFEQEGWEVTTAEGAPLEAVKDGVRVAVDLTGAGEATPFTVSYRPTVQAALEPAEPLEDDGSEDNAQAAIAPGPAQSFTDLSEAPEDFRSYIRDLAALGILDPGEGDQFQPNEPVTRRTFARWLYNANNAFYTESAKRIRAATGSDAVFQDLSSSNPDFAKIQGLADAGIVPSPLSGEATVVNFRPDASLTRETLLQWKVPLDLRRSLPNATVEAVAEAWGFQDAAKINPNALQAVLADYANGNQANIRRAFGFTTLLQPQKPVTRAEAAAALWQFGYQGETLSAAQVRQGETGEANQDETSQGEASQDEGNQGEASETR